MFWNASHEAVDLGLIYHRAGRIVRVGDKDETCLICDRLRHRIEVMKKSWVWHLDIFCTKQCGHEFVDHKRMFRGDEFRIAI